MADRRVVVEAVRSVFGDRLVNLEDRMSAANENELPEPADPHEPDIASAPSGELPDRAVVSGVVRAEEEERQQLLREGTAGLRKVIDGRDDELTPREQVGLEAIIVLEGRPPLFIQGGDFVRAPVEWLLLNDHRDEIKASIARVGRVEVVGHPDFEWIGTGFLAGPDAIITNRHVAREFARAEGDEWRFEAGMSASLDFNEEHGALAPLEFDITGIVGIHDHFDLAVLRIAPTGGEGRPLPDPLLVAARQPGTVADRQVYVVGYPAWDGRRNDPTYMRQIFSNIYDVKRLQPGLITGWTDGSDKFVHDCSTLGGNSGSPVFDLETHQVVGLHFGGRYLSGNNAVPLWRLTDDRLLRAAGVNFVGPALV
jgi:S1-C subfamily serine protease